MPEDLTGAARRRAIARRASAAVVEYEKEDGLNQRRLEVVTWNWLMFMLLREMESYRRPFYLLLIIISSRMLIGFPRTRSNRATDIQINQHFLTSTFLSFVIEVPIANT